MIYTFVINFFVVVNFCHHLCTIRCVSPVVFLKDLHNYPCQPTGLNWLCIHKKFIGLFLLALIAFWTGHLVACYVCSLVPLTPLTCSAALCFVTFTSLAHCDQMGSLTHFAHFWDRKNQRICVDAKNALNGNKCDRPQKYALCDFLPSGLSFGQLIRFWFIQAK